MKKQIQLKRGLILLLATLLFALPTVPATPVSAAGETPALAIFACNLAFLDRVGIRVAVTADHTDGAVSLLVFTEGNGSYDYENRADEITDFSVETVRGVSCLVFDYTALAAKQMTDTVYFRAYTVKDETTYYSETQKYSVLQYAYNKLGKTGAAGSESLQALLTEMLSYGAAAQAYFDYHTERLATANFYQVSLTEGALIDGFTHGLYQEGETVTVTAPESDGVNDFTRWKNESSATVSESASFTYTVGTKNVTLTPVYGDDGGEPAIAFPATFTAQSYESDTIVNYWLYTPADPGENMPLIVYLHGGSGKGNDLTLLTNVDGFPKYLRDGDLGDVRAYVIMPQLPSGITGWTNAGADLIGLIGSVRSTYGIPSNKVSLTGHSMGGTGTWGVAAQYPKTFARIAPCSGSISNTTLNVSKLKSLPVRAFVGSADTIVSPDASINFVAALTEAGNTDATVTVFDGSTHFDVPALVYLDEDIGIVNWLAFGGG